MGLSWVVVVLWGDYCVPFEDSSPRSHTPAAFSACRVGSPRAPALHQEVEARLAKGALEITPRSGSWLSSRLFLMDLTSDCWRPLIILSPTDRVHPAYSVPEESSHSVLFFFRERVFFLALFGSGNRVFSDPNTSILMNAFDDPRQRGRSIHSAPRVFMVC